MKELPQDFWSFSLGRIFFGRLANLFRRRARARKEFGNRACRRFQFEPLERRLLLSADFVYVDDNFTGSAGTAIVDADPVAGGNQAAVIGVNAFATVQDGVNAVAQGGMVKVNAGTYAESVSITQALTLDGNAISGLPGDVVIDPAAGNGITVSGADADNITIRDLRVTGGVDGINASGVDNLTLTNLQADFNTDDGIEISSAGTIGFSDVDAANNGDAGVVVSGAGSFSDSDGIYSSNTNHGIQLIDIGGLVSLTRVTANDNDANIGGIGDGVNMIDGADAGTEAIGSLLVVGGSFSDTAAPGAQRFGIRVGDGVGVGAIHSVGGDVSFDGVTVTGNQNSGVEIEDGGTTASITGNGNYSGNGANGPNQGSGFTIASLSGSFTASGSTFSNNTSHGLNLTSTGDVNLTGISANDNTGDGIRIIGAGAVTADTVTANGNDPGVFVNGAASFSDTDGVYTGNDTHGIQLIDIAGAVSLTRTTANDNDADNDFTGDGVNMTDGAGDGDTNAVGSLVVTGGSFSNTAAAGGQVFGIRVGDGIGIGAVHSVATTVAFQSDGGVGPLQHVSVTGNQNSGVEIEDGGTTASFTGNGNYSSNFNAGVTIASLSGGFTAADSTFSGNTNHGIQLIDIGGLVSLTRVTANDNDANIGGIGDGVNMIDGADAGTEAIGSLLVVGGSFSDTAAPGAQRFGIRVGDGVGVGAIHSVGGDVSFDGVTVTGNQNSGVEIEDGGTTASITGNGNYSGNGANGPNQGSGFTIASLSGSFTASGSTFSNNTSHGLNLTSTGDVNLTGISANDNTGDGIRIIGAGAVTADTVTANGNDPGVFVNGAASFSDTDGVYTGNDTHGIQLIDIAGAVSLTRTTANDNDADNDFTGDGVNMTDGAGDGDTNAVGSLVVTGGSFSNTAAAGGQVFGIRVGDGIGIGAVHSVATTVAFQSDGGVGPLQHVSVTGNQNSGVEIEDGGTTASFTGNGNYSSNFNAGVTIASLSGGFTAADSTFSGNTNHGIQLIDIGGLVSLTRVTANDNDANIGGIGDGVNMIDGADAGTEAIGSLLVVGGSFSDTAAPGAQRFGIRVGDGVGVGAIHSVGGDVSFDGVTVTGNQNSGVEIEDGGTTASITGNGNYSGNGANGPNQGSGFTIASLSGSFTASGSTFSNNGSHGLSLIDVDGAVSLTGVTATDNGGNGLNAVDGSDGGTLAVGGLTVSGSTFDDTAAGNAQGVGVLAGNIGGDVVFNDVGASGNDAGGVDIEAVSGSVTFTSATGASYSNNGGDGVNVASLTGTLTVSGISASDNTGQGLKIGAGATAASIGDGTFNGNTGGDGISLGTVGGAVALTNVTASGNFDAGVSVSGAVSFSDSDGVYSGNVNHGIQLIDIGGLVSLTHTTANDNDANLGGIGDGVNMTDGADAGTDAIGSLLVVGGSFSDTAAAGVQRYGIRVGDGVGVGLVHSVGATVALESVTVAGNLNSGVEIEDGGTTATFTNGTYSNNGGDGISIASLATTLTVSGVTASNNAGDGLDISGGGTTAFLSGVFSNNASGRGVNLASDTIFVNGSLSSGTGAIVLTAPSGVFFTADAVLHVDLGGNAAGQFTKVIISDAVTLDGALDAALVNGFVPANGDRFQFMTFTSRLGFFDITTLPAQLYVDQSDPADLELVFDSTPPTVTIDQAATQTDPTATSPILFTVHFSEVITGFTGSDISFAGSTVGGTLTAVVTGSGQNYAVSVMGMSGNGQVVVSLPAGAATDVAGNLSLASTSTDNMVFFGHAPDLIGTVQWVPDAVIVPGQQEHVTVSVINVGDRAAHDPAVVKLYASVNAVLDASDILLDQGTVSGTINPGASKSDHLNFAFPGAVPPGTYFLLAVVDATNSVLESNEANNVAVGPVFNVGGISSLGLEASAGNFTFGAYTTPTGGIVDWQAGWQDGWGTGLNPFAPNKPGKDVSPNFADFLITPNSADRGAQGGGYDSLGSELLGNGKGKLGR